MSKENPGVVVKMTETRFIAGNLAERDTVGEVSKKDARYLTNKGWAVEASAEDVKAAKAAAKKAAQ